MAHNCNRLRTAHILCAVATLSAAPTLVQAEEQPPAPSVADFPALPLPPPIDGLIGLPQTYTKARSSYLALITREAEQKGLPPALADAVVKVESGFNPYAVGGVGEVGLMQVRPETAAMLGYQGGATGLFDPETNVRLGVTYLARAWQLANGDVCRALMKYRAGWGEERMTPLSVEYCRRARGHLAAIGSPLAGGAVPTSEETSTSFSRQQAQVSPRRPERIEHRVAQAKGPLPAALPGMQSGKPRSARPTLRPERVRVAALGAVKLSDAQVQALQRARDQERIRAEQKRQLWADHASRLKAIEAKLKPTQMKIMSGL